MTIRWPDQVLSPRGLSVDLASRSLSGPASISGSVQVVASDAGIWKVTFDAIPVVSEQKIKAWRAVAGLMEGRLNPIVMPISRFYQPAWVEGENELVEPVPHSDQAFFGDGAGYVGSVNKARLAGSVAARATTANVVVTYGGQLEPGQHFSIGERLYRIRTSEEIEPKTPAGTVLAERTFGDDLWIDLLPTFTRSSRASCWRQNGLLRIAENNEPRFDHDPMTGQPLGLLIETQRTNLCLWSEEIGSAAWSRNSTTVSSNAEVAPDGTTTADVMTASGGFTYQTVTVTPGSTYTFSYFAKLLTMPALALAVYDASNAAFIVDSTNSGATGAAFSRASVTFTAPAGCTSVRIYVARGQTGSYVVWGVQLEQGGAASSYIPTTTAAATRAGDSLSFTLPSGVYDLSYTFGGGSTLATPGVSGSYTVPANLPRRHIQSIDAKAAS